MSLTFGALIALYALGLGPGSWLSVQWVKFQQSLAGGPRVDDVRFVDGPLAGVVDQLSVGGDGLPPLQICATVRRDGKEGGDYTLPYQRDMFCESERAWLYTQGWQVKMAAGRGVDGMGTRTRSASHLFASRQRGDQSGRRQVFIEGFTDQKLTDRVDGG